MARGVARWLLFLGGLNRSHGKNSADESSASSSGNIDFNIRKVDFGLSRLGIVLNVSRVHSIMRNINEYRNVIAREGRILWIKFQPCTSTRWIV